MKQPGYRNPYQATVDKVRAREIKSATLEAARTGPPFDLRKYRTCSVKRQPSDKAENQPNQVQSDPSDKTFLGVYYVQCRVYGRMYRNAESTAYIGRCPRCGKMAQARIGAQGYSDRFFKAYCRA